MRVEGRGATPLILVSDGLIVMYLLVLHLQIQRISLPRCQLTGLQLRRQPNSPQIRFVLLQIANTI